MHEPRKAGPAPEPTTVKLAAATNHVKGPPTAKGVWGSIKAYAARMGGAWHPRVAYGRR